LIRPVPPMAQSESRDTDSLLPTLKAGGFFASEATRIQTLTELQKQLLDTFEQLSREQLARMKQETELASDLAGKVTSASSMRDVMSAYQDWFSKRMALFAEDGRNLLQTSHKIVNATMKMMPNGKLSS